jgi:hypothetical protein
MQTKPMTGSKEVSFVRKQESVISLPTLNKAVELEASLETVRQKHEISLSLGCVQIFFKMTSPATATMSEPPLSPVSFQNYNFLRIKILPMA